MSVIQSCGVQIKTRRLQVASNIATSALYVITWITTQFATLEGWKAELA